MLPASRGSYTQPDFHISYVRYAIYFTALPYTVTRHMIYSTHLDKSNARIVDLAESGLLYSVLFAHGFALERYGVGHAQSHWSWLVLVTGERQDAVEI